MTHAPTPPTDPQADPQADLRAALDAAYPAIEEAVADFLVRREGVQVATDRLRGAVAALRRHIYLEEEHLFPPLRAGGMAGPVHAMSVDHRELWETLDRIEAALATPEAVEAQRTACRILLAQLDRHTSKEDPIVFGHAADVLSVEQQTMLRELAETVVVPAGWVCPDPSET